MSEKTTAQELQEKVDALGDQLRRNQVDAQRWRKFRAWLSASKPETRLRFIAQMNSDPRVVESLDKIADAIPDPED